MHLTSSQEILLKFIVMYSTNSYPKQPYTCKDEHKKYTGWVETFKYSCCF
jgi:hypothetical protein